MVLCLALCLSLLLTVSFAATDETYNITVTLDPDNGGTVNVPASAKECDIVTLFQ